MEYTDEQIRAQLASRAAAPEVFRLVRADWDLGNGWMLRGPDGLTAGWGGYHSEQSADDAARALNRAYALGRADEAAADAGE